MKQASQTEDSRKPIMVGNDALVDFERSASFANLDRAFRAALIVPKADLLKDEAKVKQQRDRKRARKKIG